MCQIEEFGYSYPHLVQLCYRLSWGRTSHTNSERFTINTSDLHILQLTAAQDLTSFFAGRSSGKVVCRSRRRAIGRRGPLSTLAQHPQPGFSAHAFPMVASIFCALPLHFLSQDQRGPWNAQSCHSMLKRELSV